MSVPVRTDVPAPPQVGALLTVAGGSVRRVDTTTRREVLLPLPRGVAALRAWQVGPVAVALGRLPDPPVLARLPAEDRPAGLTGRTAAWVVRPGRRALPLGRAEAVVPSADGRTVWLVRDGVASRAALRSDQRPTTVALPPGARLVADTPSGLITTTGTVADPDQPTPSPTATTVAPSGTATAPPTAGGPGSAVPATAGAPTGTTAGGPGGGPAAPPEVGQPGGDGDAAGAAEPEPPVPDGEPPAPQTTDPAAVPLTTTLIRSTGLVRVLAEAEALAGYGDVVLVRRADERLGIVSLRGPARPPRWLPMLSAVEVTGPAAVNYDGAAFAVLARVNKHVRLMVGPTDARNEADIHVVALEGGPPALDATPPAFTASGRVLAVRPDGKIVYYLPGSRQGVLLGVDLPPATAVTQG